jgi:hypothetical protein
VFVIFTDIRQTPDDFAEDVPRVLLFLPKQRLAKPRKETVKFAETDPLTEQEAGWGVRAALPISPPEPNHQITEQSAELALSPAAA